ncbi:MAG: proline--tRNA ligase [Nanoarchaeota archaeon]|nr:proline--tRNA ligase [Nanoarchaeota archaeon]
MPKKEPEVQNQQSNQLTAKKQDFSSWYSQILSAAEVIDKRYNIKGMFVWLPYGYKAMLNIKAIWDKLYQENGIKEMYFPLLIPKEYAEINDSWFKGFKDEAFWVKAGSEKKPNYILRPTGEPAMYPMFKLWTRTYSDLPIRIYETVSSFRYETKHTRPLIRDREITVWYEIHTAHETKEESEKEAKLHEEIQKQIWKKLAINPIIVQKPGWECFPGAIGAVEFFNIMPTGKIMENGSINLLGQSYSKKFEITFKDKKGKIQNPWMVCTGNGARLLAAVIAIHGDDKGLIIPPEIAPVKIVIIPIIFKKQEKEIITKVKQVQQQLKKAGMEAEADLGQESPGSKFYNWELKGVPIRIEIGPRDIKNKSVTMVRRDTSQKITVKEKDIMTIAVKTLADIQQSLLKKAEKLTQEKIKKITNKKEIKTAVEKGFVVQAGWCGSGKCWDKVKEIQEGIEIFGSQQANTKTTCIICSKPCSQVGYIGNTY